MYQAVINSKLITYITDNQHEQALTAALIYPKQMKCVFKKKKKKDIRFKKVGKHLHRQNVNNLTYCPHVKMVFDKIMSILHGNTF